MNSNPENNRTKQIEKEIQAREKVEGTWLQRSHVKGKKSICLQSSTVQCFPRSGNSGVPIGIRFQRRWKNGKKTKKKKKGKMKKQKSRRTKETNRYAEGRKA
jgi:hypothetical protein